MEEYHPEIDQEELKKVKGNINSFCEELLDPNANYTGEEFTNAFITINKQALHVLLDLDLLEEFCGSNAGIGINNVAVSQREKALIASLLQIFRRIVLEEYKMGYGIIVDESKRI